MKKTNKAIGYCRVATSTQIDQVEKLQIQKQQIIIAASSLNVEIVKWCEQVGSGAQSFPYYSLDEVLGYCKSNPDIDVLVVTKADRISRSLELYHYWKVCFERLGVTIKAVDHDDLNELVKDFTQQVQFLVAKQHSDQLSARVKKGLMLKKKVGILK